MDENNRNLNTENINKEEISDELAYENVSFDSSSAKMETDSKKKKSWQRELYEWASCIAVAVVLALLINTFFFSLVQVDGHSMVPTLNHGERLIVRKIAYTPDNGDIVIVKSEVFKKYIVKRVIALPGQKIDFDAGRNATVDGAAIDEPYIASLQASTGGLYQYPVTVPKKGEKAEIGVILAEQATKPNEVFVSMNGDKIVVTGSSFVPDGVFTQETTYTQDGYFVMGDNRNGSSDSRTHGIVPEDEIVGKAVIRFSPLSAFGSVK